MASRNQNKPPHSHSNKKIGAEEMERQGVVGRARAPLSAVVNNAEGTDSNTIEFTKEDIEALLIEKMKKGIPYDNKKKMDQMVDLIKRLKLCVRWCVDENDKLHSEVESAAKKCCDTEMEMKNKTDELNDTISDMRRTISSLEEINVKEKLEKSEACRRLEVEKSIIVESLNATKELNKELQDRLKSLKDSQSEAIKHKEMLENELTCLREELKKITEDRDRIQGQLNAVFLEQEKYIKIKYETLTKLNKLAIKTEALEETCSSQKETITTLEQTLRSEREKSEMADLSALQTRTMLEEQKRIIRELRDQLTDKEFQVVEGEKLRKKLHNTVLELKGNIRVFCRVRPLLREDRSETDMAVSYPTSMEMLGRGIELVQNAGQKQLFTFDKVFNHGASQQEVFTEISQLVQSALDGYKVCIFAYGQTGSGKTYTMMGRPDAPDLKGMIPLSLEQIFQTSQSLKDQGWNFKMQASVLEIYNETIKDLLLSNRSSGFDQTRAENSVHGKQYTIRHDKNGNTHVLDLTIVDVCSVDEISSLLQKAAQIRSMGRTQMNEQSSRSHFVVTLRICGTNENTEQQVQGVLNLIDLAGSERLSRSGATGDRLKETQAINQSLSSLSNVIFALAKKEEHVPFRDSKLTHLLQPCLEGDSKTLMFVNISPDQSSIDESLCSLRFAARVNAVKLGFQGVRPRHIHGA
ncbi:kinesin-like protein KIN-14C isoform X1 [Trifolium pratense]|uniref:kinesin-like protein KIN-14C isoform X1 n=1 Tax=Trifolium pratense TaxID=57577 RepID=UPI001E691C4B|nr:kinesin-like protein KIN-14C isoform X1 [Trifolium pratense]XP_045826071.1 kinesin-like protein KIN-14C isoform X1 [Trifolium pratense]XP_045826072.1 kinesin-like protein KIN-14C isoform X1 [Trifolium pratense]